MIPVSPSCSPSPAARGFTLVEALAALAIFTIAVLIAAAFLQAHVQAARRLEVRSKLISASEVTIEEIRGGLRPMVSATLDRGREFGSSRAASLRTSITVEGGDSPDLYHIMVTSRTAESGQPMAVSIETMVWRP